MSLSRLVFRAGCGIRLSRFLFIASVSTSQHWHSFNNSGENDKANINNNGFCSLISKDLKINKEILEIEISNQFSQNGGNGDSTQ